ncbi:MAG TPA: hypothetical protein VF897_20375 [Roseiflexaceae bacterium]
MSSTLVVPIYLAALGLPVFLLYRFQACAWYWHLFGTAAALGIGFLPTPPEWKTPLFDMAFGLTFIFLMVWGVGGLMLAPGHHRGHRETHHHA